MGRIAPTVLATTVLVGGMALAPEAHSTRSAAVQCTDPATGAGVAHVTFEGFTSTPPEGHLRRAVRVEVDGVPAVESIAVFTVPSIPGGETFTYPLAIPGERTVRVLVGGHPTPLVPDQLIAEVMTSCQPSSTPPPSADPPAPPVAAPSPTSPSVPPAVTPSTTPTGSPATSPGAGTEPSMPPASRPRTIRLVRKHFEVYHGCLGPWSRHPQIRGVRVRLGADGRWHSFNDVRVYPRVLITWKRGGKVIRRKVGRQPFRIAARGAYCGPVSPAVAG